MEDNTPGTLHDIVNDPQVLFTLAPDIFGPKLRHLELKRVARGHLGPLFARAMTGGVVALESLGIVSLYGPLRADMEGIALLPMLTELEIREEDGQQFASRTYELFAEWVLKMPKLKKFTLSDQAVAIRWARAFDAKTGGRIAIAAKAFVDEAGSDDGYSSEDYGHEGGDDDGDEGDHGSGSDGSDDDDSEGAGSV